MLRVEQWTLSFNKGVEFIVGNEIRVIEALFECAKFHYYNSKRSFFFFYSLSITLRILLRQPKVLFILFQFYCFIFPNSKKDQICANPRCESHVILRDSGRGGDVA